MTRLQLRNLIRKRLGETTAAFWDDTELNQWINNAGHDVAYKTKCIKANGYITTTSDGEYTLSNSFPNWLSVLRVYMYSDAQNWIKLIQTDENRLDEEVPGWKNADASTPYKYYEDRERDLLGLFPTPNSTNQGTDYLQVYYANDFTDITSDEDDLLTIHKIPFELQTAMGDWVVATGYETRGWGEKANDAWSKYASKLQHYVTERDTEKQVDEEALLMKNYRNIH